MYKLAGAEPGKNAHQTATRFIGGAIDLRQQADAAAGNDHGASKARVIPADPTPNRDVARGYASARATQCPGACQLRRSKDHALMFFQLSQRLRCAVFAQVAWRGIKIM
jgi:hypothetical protein